MAKTTSLADLQRVTQKQKPVYWAERVAQTRSTPLRLLADYVYTATDGARTGKDPMTYLEERMAAGAKERAFERQKMMQDAIRVAAERRRERQSQTQDPDLNAFQQGNFDQIRRWDRLVPTLVALYESDDENARKAAGQIMSAYFNQIEPHLMVMDPEWTKRFREEGRYQYVERPKGAKGFLAEALDRINDPLQGVMHAIGGIREEGLSGDSLKYGASSILRGLQSAGNFIGTFGIEPYGRQDVRFADRRMQVGDQLRNISARAGDDGYMTLREALGTRWQGPGVTLPGFVPGIGNKRIDAGGVADLGAEILLDPLNLVGVGPATKAKLGLRSALRRVTTEGIEGMEKGAARALVEDAVRKIQWRGGWKALTDEQKKVMEALIHQETAEASLRVGNNVLRTQRARNRLQQMVSRSFVQAERSTEALRKQWATRKAEGQIASIQRSGRVGIRVAGRTAIPFPEVPGLSGRWAARVVRRTAPVVSEGIVDESRREAGTLGFANDWVLGYDVSGPVNQRIKNAEKAYRDAVEVPETIQHAYIQTALKGGDPMEFLEPLIDQARLRGDDSTESFIRQLDDELRPFIRPMVEGNTFSKAEMRRMVQLVNRNNPEEAAAFLREVVEDPEMLPKIISSAVSNGYRWEDVLRPIRDLGERYGGWNQNVLRNIDELFLQARQFDEIAEESRAMFKGKGPSKIGRQFGAAERLADEAAGVQDFRPAGKGTALLGDIGTRQEYAARVRPTTPRQLERLRFAAEVFDDPERTVVTRGRRTIPGVDAVLDALSPRRKIRRGPLGPSVAEAMDEVTTLARAARDAASSDHQRRVLGKLAVDAAKEAKKLDITSLSVGGDTMRRLARAQSGGERLKVIENVLLGNVETDLAATQLRMALEQAGANKILQMVDTLWKVRDEITDISRSAGVDEDILREAYLPRVKNQDAVRRIEKELARRHGGDLTPEERGVLAGLGMTWDQTKRRINFAGLSDRLTQEGRLEPRKFAKEIEDLGLLNQQAHEMLKKIGLDVADLFDDDPHTAMITRANTAYQAKMATDVLQWAARTVDNTGLPLAYIARNAEELRRLRLTMNADTHAGQAFAKYVERSWPGGGKVFVHPDIADEISSSYRLLSDPATEGRILQFLDRWNNLWAGWATVGGVAGLSLGYHSRNELGNILNMVLAGMKNPRYLTDAMRFQNINAQIYKVMERTGKSFDEAMAEIPKLSDRDRLILRDIRERGFSQGGQTADLFVGNKALGESRQAARKAKQAGLSSERRNPLQRVADFAGDNALLRGSRDFGTVLEENAKIALYLDGIDKGLSPAAATQRVHQYLFDYTDLTGFEAKLRRISRFYTFTRKNATLFAGALFSRPGAVAANTRIAERWTQLFTGDRLSQREPGIQEDGTIVPDWAADDFRYSARTGVMVSADTPFSSFAEVYNSFWGMAGLLPFLPYNALAPEHQRHYDVTERTRNFTLLFSGGPVSAITYLAEMQTGVDTFTGFKLKNDAWSRFTNALDVIAPVLGRTKAGTEGWLEVLKSQIEGHPDADRILALRLMNALAGFNTVDLRDPEKAEAAMNNILYDIERTLYDHRDAFIAKHGEDAWDALSMENLREAGKIQARNEVARIMLLYPRKEWAERLEKLIPKATLRRLGLPTVSDDAALDERDDEWYRNRVNQILDALDAFSDVMGLPPLTAEERLNVTLLNAGVTMTGLEELGIEPWRENQHLRDSKGRRTAEQQADEAAQRLIALGLNPAEVAKQKPLLTWAERFIKDSREAGWSEQEILDYMVEDLSRTNRAILQNMGIPVDNDPYRYPRLTQEQIEKREKEIPNIDAKLDYIFMAYAGRPPTDEERFTYHYQSYLTKGEQRLVGLPKGPKVPSRTNMASEGEQRLDALAKVALSRGESVDKSEFPTELERAAWERRLNNR